MKAVISDCGKYRYLLSRETYLEEPEIGGVLIVMLNPSIADDKLDDPTIRRCVSFAKSWGSGSVTVANLYAIRSTNPKAIKSAADPIGPDNNIWLKRCAEDYGDIVCAWGNNADPERVKEFCKIVGNARLFCLGTTKSGMPKHPLYIKSDTKLVPWNGLIDGTNETPEIEK